MSESYSESSTVLRDAIRTVFSTLDRPVYFLLMLSYELFFNVASADIFSNDTLMKFYGRVQVVLGVFMMFQLAMTFLRGIVEPDSFSKDKGGGSFLKRVVTSLMLITLLMPIGTGGGNEYQKQINNNGLLFGTLYSLQHRILANNTLGRLVLGTTDSSTTFMGNESSDSELQKAAKVFTSTVLKGFYRINLVPEEMRVDSGTKDPATINENRMCKDIDDSVLEAYTRLDADPGEIISMVNETCIVDFNLLNYLPFVDGLFGTKKYVFNYIPVVSTVVGIIFIFVLLSFSVDVAVRAVKLAVLRLIAPIPLIAYMDPKGSKDDSFKAWTKALTSTYLDLFIRLAVVYFVIFLIQDMIVNGFVINSGSGILGIFSAILLWIGLFIFAKQAPKFIREVLGLKGDGGKLFSGFGEVAAAATVPLAGVSGGISNAVAKATNTSGNAGKKIAAGIGGFITGSVGGSVNAGRGFFTSKDFDAKGNMARIREYNARNYSNASDDSTLFGRMKAGFQGTAGLRNELERYDEKIARYQRAEGAWKGIQNALDSDSWKGATTAEHATRGGFVSGAGGFVSSKGDSILSANTSYSIKDLKDIQGRMKSSGAYSEDDLKSMDQFVKSAEKSRFDYIRKNSGSLKTPRERQVYEGAVQISQTAAKYTEDADGVWADWKGHTDIGDSYFDGNMASMFKGAAFAAGAEAGQIKSSAKYAQASSNAKRAAEAKKK